jgi:cell division protein FtsB
MTRALRHWLGRRWHLLGGVLLLVYFAYHGLHGERGLYAWVDKARELEAAKLELAGLERSIGAVQRTVEGLQPDRVDPDLLEERLRRLGWVAPDEVLVLTPDAAAR